MFVRIHEYFNSLLVVGRFFFLWLCRARKSTRCHTTIVELFGSVYLPNHVEPLFRSCSILSLHSPDGKRKKNLSTSSPRLPPLRFGFVYGLVKTHIDGTRNSGANRMVYSVHTTWPLLALQVTGSAGHKSLARRDEPQMFDEFSSFPMDVLWTNCPRKWKTKKKP